MTLSNVQKDVVGYLRAVHVLVAWWHCPTGAFPLDAEMARAIAVRRSALEANLGLAGAVAHLVTEAEVAELRAAVDGLPDGNGAVYNERTARLHLRLYSGGQVRADLPFNDRVRFCAETRPVFETLLYNLVDACLWARITAYDRRDGTPVPPPGIAGLPMLVQGLCAAAPPGVGLESPESLTRTLLARWLESEPVGRSRSATRGRNTGLTRVLEEVRAGLERIAAAAGPRAHAGEPVPTPHPTPPPSPTSAPA